MSQFDAETAAVPTGEGVWATLLSAGWNIADNSNGGYAVDVVAVCVRTGTPGVRVVLLLV